MRDIRSRPAHAGWEIAGYVFSPVLLVLAIVIVIFVGVLALVSRRVRKGLSYLGGPH
jgi:hypothetical protein